MMQRQPVIEAEDKIIQDSKPESYNDHLPRHPGDCIFDFDEFKVS